MRDREGLGMAGSTSEKRTERMKEPILGVFEEQDESWQTISRLDRYYEYVDHLTYLDICSGDSSVTLINPVTNLAESPLLEITESGNVQTFQNASPEATVKLGKVSTQRPASIIKAQADAGMKNKFGQYNRRDFQ